MVSAKTTGRNQKVPDNGEGNTYRTMARKDIGVEKGTLKRRP